MKARQKPGTPRKLSPPTVPLKVAREVAAGIYLHDDKLIARHWRGDWWEWKNSKWVPANMWMMNKELYEFTEEAVYETGIDPPIKPWEPTRAKLSNVLHALASITQVHDVASMPFWVEDDGSVNESKHSDVIVSVENGLLDVRNRRLMPHDPSYFNNTSVPFAYAPQAPEPKLWYRFLNDLWGDDQDSIDALAEWFGYVISGRLDLHKIMLIVGPTRAGKGVITRTLSRLVGVKNVAGPTLSSLNGEFGLAPLLGKTLAVVADARLGRGTHEVVGRLLSISGEDMLTVNRKYTEQWSGTLPARLMICSNELPQFGDASAAIAGRFVPLLLTKSFYGREDLMLEDRLERELPGILNWALDGLDRLEKSGKFTRPANVDDTIRALQDLASPINAFVREQCKIDSESQVPCDDLYLAWREWAERNGHVKTAKTTFGRDLNAAYPSIQRARIGSRDNRVWIYSGIGL